MEPYASLMIGKWFSKDREATDIAHVSNVLGVQPDPREEPEVPYRSSTFGAWLISTEGHVQSRSIQSHVSWLLDKVGGYSALEPLRADENFALSVFFFDTTPTDPAEEQSVMKELERHGITFDFELERDDFP